MKHPIYKVIASAALIIITLGSLYYLFCIVSSPNKALQDLNYAKAFLYAMSTIGASVGLLLLNIKLK